MILLNLSKTMSLPSLKNADTREALANVTTIIECFNVYLDARKVFPVSTSSSEKKNQIKSAQI